MNKLLIVSVIAALGSIAGVANAAIDTSKTTTFEVNLTVLKTCAVSATGPLSFGNADSASTADLTGTTTINVKCSKGTAYNVGLQSGNNNSNSGAGTMRGATQGNNDTVGYQLTRGGGNVGATTWGTGSNAWLPSNTNGGTESITVYGRVTGSALNVTPDTYKDTVTVTVNY